MLEITVAGRSPKITKSEIQYAAQWICKLVAGKKLSNHLTLHVVLERVSGYKGCVDYDETSRSSKNLPREFTINLDPMMSRKNIIATLAHEIVHVKQFARGEYKQLNASHSKWNNDVIHEEEVDYWDLPWEIEAFGREYGIFVRYTAHLRQQSIKFMKT